LIELGDFKRAQAFFTVLVNEISDHTAKTLCYFGLAIVYGMIRNHSRSAAMYMKALEHSSALGDQVGNLYKFFNLYRKVGTICSLASEYDLALECFALDF
jgi:hypothetical protein